MFGTATNVEFDCPDAECDGTMRAGFDGEGVADDTAEVEECWVECPGCGEMLGLFRKDWSDTPDDEIRWTLKL